MPDLDNNQDSVEDIASQLVLEPAAEEPETPVEGAKPEVKEEPKPAEAEQEEPKKPEDAELEGEGEQPKPAEAEDKKPEENPEDSEEAKKERNRQFYEQRKQESTQKQKQYEQAIDQHYKPQEVDELTKKYADQGYSEFEATMLARDERREQQAQINESRTQVAELNARIETEAIQVMHDFPVFDPGTPEKPNPLYDKDFATKANGLFLKAANTQTDPKTGLVVQTNLTPYQFYKELNDMRGSGVAKAEIDGQRAAQQQMAAVSAPPSNAPVVHQSKEEKQAADLATALENVV